MIFEFKNLGTIKEAEIEMGNLTLICGKNNTGKTYLTYAVWGFLQNIKQYVINYEPNVGINDIDFSEKKINTDILERELLLFIDFINTRDHKQNLNNIFDTSNFFQHFQSNIKFDIDFKAEWNYEFVGFSVHKPFNQSIVTINYKGTEENYELNSDKTEQQDNNQGLIIILMLILLGLFIYYVSKEQTNKNPKTIEQQGETSNYYIEPLKDLLQDVFSEMYFSNIFLLAAQRDSIQFFYKELDRNRSFLISELRKTKTLDFLEKNTARFPLPITENINFARDLTTQITKYDSFLAEEHPELLLEIENLLGVNFIVGNDVVLVKDRQTQAIVPDYMASTSVRSLMYLHFWLKHQAQKGDLLMIDEPELNLHPENQIKMARLFAKLVNVGIKVWVTTHSDYIVKELNNCLMLSQKIENKEALMQELGYKENEILRPKDVRYYTAYYDEKLRGCTVKASKIGKYGITESSFDDTLDQIVYNSETISSAIE